MRDLGMMRMICDTNYILDPDDRDCPSSTNWRRSSTNAATIPTSRSSSFPSGNGCSNWSATCASEHGARLRLAHRQRAPETPPRPRSSPSRTIPTAASSSAPIPAATGLNLQNASVVINCDLPWNPAKLEQRIARAWRKHQTRPVTVINLVAENTLEHRMLETLALKQAVADSVLDHPGKVKEMALRSGRQAFLERLNQLLAPAQLASASGQAAKNAETAAASENPPSDPAMAFAQKTSERLQQTFVRCEERYPAEGAHSVLVVVVDRNAAQWREQLNSLHQEFFGHGKTDPLAPVRLEVVDRATDEAIERLVAAGLITRATAHRGPCLHQRRVCGKRRSARRKWRRPGLSASAESESSKWRGFWVRAVWMKKPARRCSPPCGN